MLCSDSCWRSAVKGLLVHSWCFWLWNNRTKTDENKNRLKELRQSLRNQKRLRLIRMNHHLVYLLCCLRIIHCLNAEKEIRAAMRNFLSPSFLFSFYFTSQAASLGKNHKHVVKVCRPGSWIVFLLNAQKGLCSWESEDKIQSLNTSNKTMFKLGENSKNAIVQLFRNISASSWIQKRMKNPVSVLDSEQFLPGTNESIYRHYREYLHG